MKLTITRYIEQFWIFEYIKEEEVLENVKEHICYRNILNLRYRKGNKGLLSRKEKGSKGLQVEYLMYRLHMELLIKLFLTLPLLKDFLRNWWKD